MKTSQKICTRVSDAIVSVKVRDPQQVFSKYVQSVAMESVVTFLRPSPSHQSLLSFCRATIDTKWYTSNKAQYSAIQKQKLKIIKFNC